MSNLDYDVQRVFNTPVNLNTLLRNGMFSYDTTNDRIGVKRLADGVMVWFENSSATGFIKIDGTNSPTATIDWDGQDLTGVANLTVTADLTVDTDTLFVDASADKVGVNNATPFYEVDIIGAVGITASGSTASQYLLMQNSGGSLNDFTIELTTSGSITIDGNNGIILVGDAGSNSWAIGDNNATALDINEGGNSYIVVSTLDAGADIIFGNAVTDPDVKIIGTGTLNIDSLTASAIIFTDASKNLISDTSGVTSADLLDLTDGGATTLHTHTAYIKRDGSAGPTATISWGSQDLTFVNDFYSASATITGDLTVDTDTLYVDSADDRVGVGTTSPTSPIHILKNVADLLHIDRDVVGASGALISFRNGNDYFGRIGVSGNNTMSIYATNSGSVGSTRVLNIDPSGQVGIGTDTPGYTLEVNGTFDCGALTATTGDFTGAVGVAGDLAVDTDTLFVDQSADKVGVNNATPTYQFDVVGSVGITASGSTASQYLLMENSGVSLNDFTIALTTSGSITIDGNAGILLVGDAGSNSWEVGDNLADALTVNEGANTYITVSTLDTGESILLSAGGPEIRLGTTEVKIGTVASNYSEFESDGTYVANGDATTWEDINIDVATLRTGGTAPAFLDKRTSGIYQLSFAVGEELSGVFEPFHKVKASSLMYPHIHCTSDAGDTTGNVQFRLIYQFLSTGDTWLATPTTIDSGDIAISAQWEEVFKEWSATITNKADVGGQLSFTLRRIAATTDEWAGEVFVETFGLHVECDMTGSRARSSK